MRPPCAASSYWRRGCTRATATGTCGVDILFVHGDHDRIARPANSAAVARALARTADVGYVTVLGGKHAMLRRHAQFDGLAAEFTVATLLDQAVTGPVGRVRAGERWLEV